MQGEWWFDVRDGEPSSDCETALDALAGPLSSFVAETQQEKDELKHILADWLYRAYRAKAAEAALLRLREQMTQLVTAWRTEQALYPTHDSGLYAAAAVSCCANELEAELLAPPTDQAGVVPEVKP